MANIYQVAKVAEKEHGLIIDVPTKKGFMYAQPVIYALDISGSTSMNSPAPSVENSTVLNEELQSVALIRRERLVSPNYTQTKPGTGPVSRIIFDHKAKVIDSFSKLLNFKGDGGTNLSSIFHADIMTTISYQGALIVHTDGQIDKKDVEETAKLIREKGIGIHVFIGVLVATDENIHRPPSGVDISVFLPLRQYDSLFLYYKNGIHYVLMATGAFLSLNPAPLEKDTTWKGLTTIDPAQIESVELEIPTLPMNAKDMIRVDGSKCLNTKIIMDKSKWRLPGNVLSFDDLTHLPMDVVCTAFKAMGTDAYTNLVKWFQDMRSRFFDELNVVTYETAQYTEAVNATTDPTTFIRNFKLYKGPIMGGDDFDVQEFRDEEEVKKAVEQLYKLEFAMLKDMTNLRTGNTIELYSAANNASTFYAMATLPPK